MSRYAVISQSTDQREPRTKVNFTSSLKNALELTKDSGNLTYGSNAEAARNYHHTFIKVYELPVGWRKPSEQNLLDRAMEESTPSYPVASLDVLASYIEREGILVSN